MPNGQKIEEREPPADARPQHESLDETAEPEGQFPAARLQPADLPPDEHQGATEEQVSDRTGPGAGYDVSAVDESENTSGQSPGAAPPAETPEPKREDPPGPRTPAKREDPPPRRDGTDPPAPRK
jgi:hypothetical protein